MVAIVIILAGFVGLVAAVLAWLLEGGFIAVILTYVIAGNLSFAVLSGLTITKRRPEASPDFTTVIEADLQALLEERKDRARRETERDRNRHPDQAPKPHFPVMRQSQLSLPGAADTSGPARNRGLFRNR
ncbi:hypothetical protein [Pseudogemmobacter bohemicus]|uniref:hypothetical protein n=1 Tax=Pseudogemmobacter bohemicus TaxID=2250708 RepID=UPI000DD35B29|nr:hypothetical protein [Pseudogemmobacter bohemicus]